MTIDTIIEQCFKNKDKHLFLQNRNISVLKPNVFDRLIYLETLSLSRNSIKKLDKKIFEKLVQLRDLYLYNNKIKYLNVNIFNNLINLRYIYLSDNNLKNIPIGLNDNINIQDIDNMEFQIRGYYMFKSYGYKYYKRICKTLLYIQKLYRIYLFLFDFYSVY